MSQAGEINVVQNHPEIPTMFVTDSGTAIPIANTLDILGGHIAAAGTPIHTTGSTNVVTVNLQASSAQPSSSATNMGGASFSNSHFSVDANGYVTLAGGGQAIDSFTTDVSGPVTPALNGSVAVTGATNIFSDGSVANTLRLNLQGTNHSLFVGRGTNVASTSLGVATNGQIPIGSTGADPVLAAPTNGNNITWTTGAGSLTANLTGTTNHAIQLGNASGSLTSLGVATNGQIPIGSTGADPVLATITAGTGVSISNGAGSITISASGGGMTWTEVTGTSQSAAVNNGYIANNAGLVTITLPSTFAIGDVIRVGGKGAGLWRLSANTGDTIHFGSQDTSAGGSLTATNRYDCVEVVGITANSDWLVLSSIGNLTVV